MRAVTVASRLLGCLLLIGAVAWAAQTPPNAQPKPPAQATDLPPELAMVPTDSFYFAHLQVDKLFTHPITLNLLKRLPPDMLLEMQKELKVQDWGFGFTDVANATLFVQITAAAPENMNAGVIVVTKKPYDKQKLLKGMLKEPEEKKAGDKVYYLRKKKDDDFEFFQIKLHFVDEKRFVVFLRPGFGGGDDPKGMEELLALLYKKKAAGPQSEFIAAAKDHLFILGTHISEDMRKLMGQGGGYPEEMAWMEPIAQCRLNVNTVTLDKVSKARMNFRYPDAGKAKDAEEGIKHGQKVLLQQLEPAIAEMQDLAKKAKGSDDPSPSALALLLEVQTMLKTAEIQLKDKELTVTLSLKTDDAVLDHFAKFLGATWKKEKKREKDQSNLPLLAIAMHNYHGDFNHLPQPAICDKNGKPLLSWRVALLPYLGQDELYKKFKLEEPWDSDHNKKLLAQIPELYQPPTVDKEHPEHTYYKVFVSPKGAKVAAVFAVDEKVTLAQIKDGTSHTILVIEGGDPVPWTKPEDISFDADKPLPRLELPFRTCINVAFADGSARQLKKGSPEKLLKQLITRNGGEKEDYKSILVEDE